MVGAGPEHSSCYLTLQSDSNSEEGIEGKKQMLQKKTVYEFFKCLQAYVVLDTSKLFHFHTLLISHFNCLLSLSCSRQLPFLEAHAHSTLEGMRMRYTDTPLQSRNKTKILI